MYEIFLKLFSSIGKRQRFIIATVLLTLLYIGATFFSFEELYIFIPIILVSVYILTFFSILEGISRHEWIMLFIHPMYFALVWYLFYFFVPQRWLTRLPFLTIYFIFTYAILLSQNIFNVGVSRSLQLFRAAFSVNYLLLTVSAFLSYSLIISLRTDFATNGVLILIASFPLMLHALWSVEPREYVSKELIQFAAVLSVLLAEAGIIISFMPINQSIFALVLTSLFYSLAGMFHTYLQGALFRERVREYVLVALFALVVLMLTVRW
ncbi:hypothetical protein A3B02_01805 [Candidatus Roizmanbacteria bacterium RIFCSPLOWO2_01_FULL_42_14]|uniref:Uncharacterized protein n=3 Tax=Candidatus Roizmaniibacteriota TaxID=1752723 RepID=A0A1F7J7Z3_9BACT|nr:MAG: hypothetical protein A3D08_03455 [Candidatus Roizmanbacteria bacterium RIFCSPHIGHO2_02_FULL_43_11]OGK38561.1 MAG: hypothetical protein A3F32_00350 [Candidatus Roizmanbacteria bacterium RIFCSPHIGHO2_12_FULL_42_10]OGK51701.1 MAG: hypothetical protein A3B02_01805 [Candidatus Roizmanbacteria bacterium RIFCSPLOWO2_01_FULL_42_14]